MNSTIVGTGYNFNDSLRFESLVTGADIPTFNLISRVCWDPTDIHGVTDEIHVHITNLDARRLKVLVDSVEELWDQLDERLGQLLDLQAQEENEIADAEEKVEQGPVYGETYAH